jgi:hypothetical protein
VADRFNEYQVDEEALAKRLGWDSGELSQIRNEFEDTGYTTRRCAPRVSEMGLSGSSRRASTCARSRWRRDALRLKE